MFDENKCVIFSAQEQSDEDLHAEIQRVSCSDHPLLFMSAYVKLAFIDHG